MRTKRYHFYEKYAIILRRDHYRGDPKGRNMAEATNFIEHMLENDLAEGSGTAGPPTFPPAPNG